MISSYALTIAAIFWAASETSFAVIRLRPDLLEDSPPSSTLVPSIRITTGTLIPDFLGRFDNTVCQPVTSQDAAENIYENALYGRVGQDDSNPFSTCSALAPPPTSRKLAGAAPAC